MPFSVDNPNRNRNYVIATLCGTVIITAILGAFVALSLAQRDTTEFYRFLVLIIGSLVPSVIAAFRANTAAHRVTEVQNTVTDVTDKLNGGLDERLRQANRDTTDEIKLAAEEILNKGKEAGDGRPTV